MNSITYSFIIPHKNSLELLQRCVNSIPRRDDVQIIVVDDNSSKEIVDWEKFKFDNSKCIELVLTTEGKGAGYARNIGLSTATGKWCLFIDCDDFYMENFLATLDKYKDKDLDVLYFNFRGIYNNTQKTYYRYNKTSHYYTEYDNTLQSLDNIRYNITMPWNKMINTQFLKVYNIHFEEIPKGNDVLFSYMAGYFARHISVEKQCLYNWTLQQDGITNKRLSVSTCQVMIRNRCRANYFYAYIGHKSWQKSLFRKFVSLLRYNGITNALLFAKECLINKQLRQEDDFFVKQIEKEIIK